VIDICATHFITGPLVPADIRLIIGKTTDAAMIKMTYTILGLCAHPEGIKPTCACGMNAACPICGYGRGASPCNCDRENISKIVAKYKDRFRDAWQDLAGQTLAGKV
jgi:hypothetical protein